MSGRGKLTDTKLRRKMQVGKHYDGVNGLFVQAYESGARCWQQRIVIQGKRTTIGHRGYPHVSLAEARRKAEESKAIALTGRDPRTCTRSRPLVPTFAEVAQRVYDHKKSYWVSDREPKNWNATVDKYAMKLGTMLVTDIIGKDLLDILEPLWVTKSDTARRLRSYLRIIMSRVVAEGFRSDNPIDNLSPFLPSQKGKRQHHPALHYSHVPAALAIVRNSPRAGVGALVYAFLAFTAVRSLVARRALWSEIDLDRGLWTIPRSKLKTKDSARPELVVPLAPPAIALAIQARELAPDSIWVFPGPKKGQPLSDSAVSKLARENGIPAVPHGFRASFRGWCDHHGVEDPVGWACLDHQLLNEQQKAYLRHQYLPQLSRAERNQTKGRSKTLPPQPWG